ncbi:hypothetical protein AAHK20_04550 [Trinickia sp. YCB016]
MVQLTPFVNGPLTSYEVLVPKITLADPENEQNWFSCAQSV